MGSSSWRSLNQSSHSSVANSTAWQVRHGPRMDHLGLVEAVDGFGQRVVIGITNTGDRGFDAGLSQAVGVMDQFCARPPLMNGLFESIKHEARVGRAAYAPAHDPPCKCVDDKGHMNKALPCGDKSEIAHPEPVRCRLKALHAGDVLVERFME